MDKKHSFYNRIFACVVFGIALIGYSLTVSPTVAFWDCGEYTASGTSLGIPHPPGNPFFMLILRVAALLFFMFKDVGFRLNIAVMLFSAFTAMLIYLIAVRVLVSVIGIPDTTWKRITVYIGGIVAGLFCAFGSTFWFSAVEQSECNPSMFMVALVVWIIMVWYQSKSPLRDKLLLLAIYFSYLGVGIHMYSAISLLPLFLFVVLTDNNKLKDWRFWLTCLLLSAVVFEMILFIFLCPIVISITAVMSLLNYGETRNRWMFCCWLGIFAALGFSTHIYLPVRSSLNPMIDENHPATWEAFKETLGRKQYGSESMVKRMFWRRGKLMTQFGFDSNMGYAGFHLTQFFRFGPKDTHRSPLKEGFLTGSVKLLIFLIPTFFMLFGWIYLLELNRKLAIFLIFITLLTTVGIVLYMNFADGTRPERIDYINWIRAGKPGDMPVVHREVRVRDYFFTAGFMFFSMWIGISVGLLLYILFVSRDEFIRTTLAPVFSVLFAVSPALPFSQNFEAQSRRGDYIPFDYAYNLLMSCRKDAILFTNGDNDTFPLWALQEAYGIRRDVRIVNLSLLNTKWYILQLKNIEPKVPITFSDKYIEKTLNHERNPFETKTEYKMPGARITVSIPGIKEQHALRIQDKMVLHIVDANRWRKPIYFAVTVSRDNYMGLDPYLQMQGLVHEIFPYKVKAEESIDIEKTVHLLDKVYRYRGMGDGSANLNETSSKLMSNYSACFIQVSYLLSRYHLPMLKAQMEEIKRQLDDSTATTKNQKNLDSLTKLMTALGLEYEEKLNLAIGKLDQCVALMPWDWRPRLLRHEILMANNRIDEAYTRVKQALIVEPEKNDYLKMLVQVLERKGDKAELVSVLKKLAEVEPDPWYAYVSMAQNYEQIGQIDSAIHIMREYQKLYPGDRRASALLSNYESIMHGSTKNADSMAKTSDSTSVNKPQS